MPDNHSTTQIKHFLNRTSSPRGGPWRVHTRKNNKRVKQTPLHTVKTREVQQGAHTILRCSVCKQSPPSQYIPYTLDTRGGNISTALTIVSWVHMGHTSGLRLDLWSCWHAFANFYTFAHTYIFEHNIFSYSLPMFWKKKKVDMYTYLDLTAEWNLTISST